MGAILRLLQLIFTLYIVFVIVRRLFHTVKYRTGRTNFDWRDIIFKLFGQTSGSSSTYRTNNSNPFQSPYDVLGLSRNATDEEIRRRYRYLMQKYHPDKFKDLDDPDFKRLATEKFQKLQEAYEDLRRQRGL